MGGIATCCVDKDANDILKVAEGTNDEEYLKTRHNQLHYPNRRQLQPDPNPTLTLTKFGFGRAIMPFLSHKLAIYSETSITMLMLTLASLTPKFNFSRILLVAQAL